MSKLPKNKKSRLRCEQILDAAFELFLQHGYENVSLSDIITKSGGSLSSIYKYFGNKEKECRDVVGGRWHSYQCYH